MQEPSAMQGETRAHVFISGIVQGVSYRFTTLDQANQFGQDLRKGHLNRRMLKLLN
jgi:hypothetical protein